MANFFNDRLYFIFLKTNCQKREFPKNTGMKCCNRQYARPAVGRESKANESLGLIVIHLDVHSGFRLYGSSWTDRLFTFGGTTNDSETLWPRNSSPRVRGWGQLPSDAP